MEFTHRISSRFFSLVSSKQAIKNSSSSRFFAIVQNDRDLSLRTECTSNPREDLFFLGRWLKMTSRLKRSRTKCVRSSLSCSSLSLLVTSRNVRRRRGRRTFVRRSLDSSLLFSSLLFSHCKDNVGMKTRSAVEISSANWSSISKRFFTSRRNKPKRMRQSIGSPGNSELPSATPTRLDIFQREGIDLWAFSRECLAFNPTNLPPLDQRTTTIDRLNEILDLSWKPSSSLVNLEEWMQTAIDVSLSLFSSLLLTCPSF